MWPLVGGGISSSLSEILKRPHITQVDYVKRELFTSIVKRV